MKQAVMALMVILVAGFSQAVPATASSPSFPTVVQLPNGFRPEGIVIGRGTDFYAGSLDTGAIYKGDVRTGEGDVLTPQVEDRVAVGLAFDGRSGYLFAAGGPTGAAHVYDTVTGETVQSYQLATGPTFINDVVVTTDAAYFTDSFNPVLYMLPLSGAGSVGEPGAVIEIPMTGDFSIVEGFNANGIDATQNGKSLVVVNSALGALYKVDPDTGEATLIDLGGGNVVNGDGILLDGKTLYVVQNFLNQVAVVNIDKKLKSGSIDRVISDPAFRIPTTVDGFGSSLYVVNARFDTSPTPDTEYEVVRIGKR